MDAELLREMMMKSCIQPYLWFDTQALEAAAFYCDLFPDSRINSKSVLRDTPSGDCDSVSFELWSRKFEAISAGPYFKINPSISFMVNFDPLFFPREKNPADAARNKLDETWDRLSERGKPLMELGEYDFSERYGWIQDRFGLSWQLILTGSGAESRPPVMPSLLFVGENCGKAEEAGDFYRTVFSPSSQGITARYPKEMEPDREDTVMYSDFKLGDLWLTAMDSAHNHDFQFNEAVSFMVSCENQAEINYYWEKLSAVPEAEQCGWLKDKYGVSWQIVPSALNVLMGKGTERQQQAVTTAFLKMKKFRIEELLQAFEEAQ